MLNYQELHAAAILVARESGELLKNRASLKILKSSSRDTKLNADINSESLIVKKLSSIFPVLSEEKGGVISEIEPTWIIDPLDGTVNYERGIPISCISICLWFNEPLLGVIYDFNRDELFSGIVGVGAWLNGNRIEVSKTKKRSASIIFTGFPASGSFENSSLNFLVGYLAQFKKVRLLGSAALSLAYVACGRGDAYFEKGIRIWDVAAGLAIVKSAGGLIEKFDNDFSQVYADNGELDK